MGITKYENQNQLRQHVRAAWAKPFSIKHAMIVSASDRYELAHAFRMFSSELGARFIILDIDGSLTAEQIEMLQRKGPRIVLMTGLDTMSKEDLSALPEQINAGGRAMPVVAWVEEAESEARAPAEEGALEPA